MNRDELLAEMADALYQFSTTRSGANWYDKRPGIRLPYLSHMSEASCGAFREWALHATDGRVCFSVDGFAQRAGRGKGSVGILVGNGKLRFPHDDSRTSHSLSMWVEGEGKIVRVTNEPDVPWEPAIQAMAKELRECHQQVVAAIAKYDLLKESKQAASREADIAATLAVLGVQ